MIEVMLPLQSAHDKLKARVGGAQKFWVARDEDGVLWMTPNLLHRGVNSWYEIYGEHEQYPLYCLEQW